MRFASPARTAHAPLPPLPKSPPPSPENSRKPAVFKQQLSDIRSVESHASKESKYVSYSRHSVESSHRSKLLSSQLVTTLNEPPSEFTTTSTSPVVCAIVSDANALQHEWQTCTSSTLSLTEKLQHDIEQLQTSTSTYEQKIVEKDKAIEDITSITAGLYDYLHRLEIMARAQNIPWIRPATITSSHGASPPDAEVPDTKSLPQDAVFRPAMRQLLAPAVDTSTSVPSLLQREDIYLDKNVYLTEEPTDTSANSIEKSVKATFSIDPTTPNFSFNVDLLSKLQDSGGKSRRRSPQKHSKGKVVSYFK